MKRWVAGFVVVLAGIACDARGEGIPVFRLGEAVAIDRRIEGSHAMGSVVKKVAGLVVHLPLDEGAGDMVRSMTAGVPDGRVNRDFPYGRRHRDGVPSKMYHRPSAGRVNGHRRQFLVSADRFVRTRVLPELEIRFGRTVWPHDRTVILPAHRFVQALTSSCTRRYTGTGRNREMRRRIVAKSRRGIATSAI